MDDITKMILDKMFAAHYSTVYTSKPEIKCADNVNYYYLTNKNSNIICLLPLEYNT